MVLTNLFFLLGYGESTGTTDIEGIISSVAAILHLVDALGTAKVNKICVHIRSIILNRACIVDVLRIFMVSAILFHNVQEMAQSEYWRIGQASPSLAKGTPEDDNEDFSFLEFEDENDGAAKHTHQSDPHHFGSDYEPEDDDEAFENYNDFEVPRGFGREENELAEN
nr:(3S,6E)-nerolidol synthase 1-like [Ipomoea batatas]